ncbi:MAG: ATP-binding protein [Deltaproteobacteria bacterium]|nr:ATP-binding protein [Deltaproteobacteria bacterium]
MTFINRVSELKILGARPSGLSVIYGRRRVGKTALVKEFARRQKSPDSVYYSQAIEGTEALQIAQLTEDLTGLLPSVPVSSWSELLALLKTVSTKCTLIIDEFPYLLRSNSSLPSRLQKWIDHDRPKNFQLILLGSSQTMMHDIFLNAQSPLFERAGEVMHVQPMQYRYFCQKLGLNPDSLDTYLRFAMVGGIPKYWEFIDKKANIIELADRLYFEVGSRLEYEPERLLKDENIVGDQAKSILELVGRGVNRPSEIASRMGVKQTSLSGPLQLLRDASLIKREIPFGESARTTKRSLYKLHDHCLAFWFGCYSPHRSRWELYTAADKRRIISDHASRMFESDIVALFPHASRYWEPGLEFDGVRYASANGQEIIVSEIKMTKLTARDRDAIAKATEEKFLRSQLSKKFKAKIEVIDLAAGLAAMAKSD